jgi:hypothetical protein
MLALLESQTSSGFRMTWKIVQVNASSNGTFGARSPRQHGSPRCCTFINDQRILVGDEAGRSREFRDEITPIGNTARLQRLDGLHQGQTNDHFWIHQKRFSYCRETKRRLD